MIQTIKARVIATGETISVRQAKEGDVHFIDENNNPYRCEELDFNVEEESADPIERLERMMKVFKPTQMPIFPTQDEINAANLRYEKEKFKLRKEEMRLRFMSDFILKYAPDYGDMGLSWAMNLAEDLFND